MGRGCPIHGSTLQGHVECLRFLRNTTPWIFIQRQWHPAPFEIARSPTSSRHPCTDSPESKKDASSITDERKRRPCAYMRLRLGTALLGNGVPRYLLCDACFRLSLVGRTRTAQRKGKASQSLQMLHAGAFAVPMLDTASCPWTCKLVVNADCTHSSGHM